MESSYRFCAVALEGVQTGVRPLGVKGVCTAADGRVLMALRGAGTLNYACEWEFAPGGCMEPGVAPADMLLRELREETGWTADGPPVARALAFDPCARSWEIVFSLRVSPPAIPVEGWECSELRLVEPGSWPSPMSAIATQLTPLVRSVTRAG
ncbi:MAG: NUDIX domain-containing protein [Phycisphaerae bacterium]|nr:NUDIX domain-containing protein [Phycisphaerae bacterium]